MINDSISDIVQKYILIKCNYKKLFYNSVINFKNIDNLKNIYYKGTNLLTNTFSISLLYLDNLLDVYNLCEKAFVYFIEFVNQINLTMSNDSSFELTLRDAVIFSYKKTIFTLDNKLSIYSNKNINNKLIIIESFTDMLNKLFIMYDKIVFDIFYKHNIDRYRLENKYNDFLNILNTYINKNIYDINKFVKKILTQIDVENLINIDYNELLKYLKNINSLLDVLICFHDNNLNINLTNNCLIESNDIELSKTVNNYESYINSILLLIDKIISKKLYVYNFDYKNILSDSVLIKFINNHNISSIIKLLNY